jgi:hypothetical protein
VSVAVDALALELCQVYVKMRVEGRDPPSVTEWDNLGSAKRDAWRAVAMHVMKERPVIRDDSDRDGLLKMAKDIYAVRTSYQGRWDELAPDERGAWLDVARCTLTFAKKRADEIREQALREERARTKAADVGEDWVRLTEVTKRDREIKDLKQRLERTQAERDHHMRQVQAIPTAGVEPAPMRLHCPECGKLHIDEGEFAHRPHHTHACQHCGNVWRPALFNTVGVRFLPGFRNELKVTMEKP